MNIFRISIIFKMKFILKISKKLYFFKCEHFLNFEQKLNEKINLKFQIILKIGTNYEILRFNENYYKKRYLGKIKNKFMKNINISWKEKLKNRKKTQKKRKWAGPTLGDRWDAPTICSSVRQIRFPASCAGFKCVAFLGLSACGPCMKFWTKLFCFLF